MIFFHRRMRKKIKKNGQQPDDPGQSPISTSVTQPKWQNLYFTGSLDKNIKMLKAIFNNCRDVNFHEFNFAQNKDIRLAIVFTDGMVDKMQISEQIIYPLILKVPKVIPGSKITREQALDFIINNGLCSNDLKLTSEVKQAVNAILSGNTLLLVDDHAVALIIDTRGWEERSITDSIIDRLVRGPREAFVENLITNTSLLRRKIKNPALKIETFKLGRVTQTDVAVIYVEGISNPKIVTEVKSRISRIDIDGILEGGYIEELIEDSPLSPFCTINHTDRVDKVAAYLLEGRVAIMVDGTPNVMTVPALFLELIHNPEDYYQRYIFSSLVRTLRILAFFITLTSSALYIALITYHHELLPTPLLLSIAAQREAVPFPAFVEVLIMEVAFEILREGGIRMPQPLGQAVSIVGALVLGEAAVRAGLVTPATVIIIALSAIASFTFCYTATLTIRMARFPMFFLAAFLGLPGLTFGMMVILVHLANLRSFGVPYLYPFAPTSPVELKDTAIRFPWWAMLKRPHLLTDNLKRQKYGQRPRPSLKKGIK